MREWWEKGVSIVRPKELFSTRVGSVDFIVIGKVLVTIIMNISALAVFSNHCDGIPDKSHLRWKGLFWLMV